MSNEKNDYVPGSGVSVRMNDFLVRKDGASNTISSEVVFFYSIGKFI